MLLARAGYHVVSLAQLRAEKAHAEVAPWRWVETLDIKTLVDVGANTGQFARHFRNLRPECMIYSFEPLRDCFDELQRSMEGPRFEAFNVALGESDGEVTMCRSDFSPSSSLLVMEAAHKDLYPFTSAISHEIVTLRRLDSFFESVVASGGLLVKIDVQGAEAQVLRGGRRLISRADAVIAEVGYLQLYRGQATIQEIASILGECGLVFMGIMEQIVRPEDSLPVYGDALFVRLSSLDRVAEGSRECC
jgi:FkbM family methyltransferase